MSIYIQTISHKQKIKCNNTVSRGVLPGCPLVGLAYHFEISIGTEWLIVNEEAPNSPCYAGQKHGLLMVNAITVHAFA